MWLSGAQAPLGVKEGRMEGRKAEAADGTLLSDLFSCHTLRTSVLCPISTIEKIDVKSLVTDGISSFNDTIHLCYLASNGLSNRWGSGSGE